MGAEKDTVSLGNTHKQPKCLQNKGKTNKTIIGLITGIGIKAGKKLLLHKEKRQKDKCFHLHAATVLGFPKAHKCWTFDIFEVHEAQNAEFLGRGRSSKHKNGGNSGDLYLHEVQKRLGS